MFNRQKILIFILLGFLIFPAVSSAIACSGEITITNMVCNAVNVAWVIAAGVVVILWIVTGILFLFAQGAPDKLNKARTALFTSIAGTVLVILAFSAINLVGNAFGFGAIKLK